jgi:hypothetical protein
MRQYGPPQVHDLWALTWTILAYVTPDRLVARLLRYTSDRAADTPADASVTSAARCGDPPDKRRHLVVHG